MASASDQLRPDHSTPCIFCGATPTVPATGLCGPCTFGEAETAGGGWWDPDNEVPVELEPMTVGEALHALHVALPPEANFSIGRLEWSSPRLDARMRREQLDDCAHDLSWSVVVQCVSNAGTAPRQYADVLSGTDLAGMVGQAIAHFDAWATAVPDVSKPPLLEAPGSAEAAEARRRKSS